jgi:hypothetical protein
MAPDRMASAFDLQTRRDPRGTAVRWMHTVQDRVERRLLDGSANYGLSLRCSCRSAVSVVWRPLLT